jgi:hypothetical protein
MKLRKPPKDLLDKCGLEMPPSDDGAYTVKDGTVTFHEGERSWSGPAEADNASKRLCVGMYALQTQEEWANDGAGAVRAFQETLALYERRPGLLQECGRVTVQSIVLEMYQLMSL